MTILSGNQDVDRVVTNLFEDSTFPDNLDMLDKKGGAFVLSSKPKTDVKIALGENIKQGLNQVLNQIHTH